MATPSMRHLQTLVLLLALPCLLAAPAAKAQEAEEPIETDRDSFTPATVTAGAGRLILESGYSFIDNRGVPETHSFPELIARYGVSDWFELRLGSNYEVGGAANAVSGSGGGGDFDSAEIETEAKVTYGFKAALTDQDGWLPRSAAILQGATPTSGEEPETHFVATYAWGWMLAHGWIWDSAIRYGDGLTAGDAEEETGPDHFNRWAPSTVLKVAVAEQWNAHIEYFGVFTDGRGDELSQSYLSPGVHYLVTPSLEVGVRVGWGLGADAANFFSNVGIGLRL
jgi:hypothetical protein